MKADLKESDLGGKRNQFYFRLGLAYSLCTQRTGRNLQEYIEPAAGLATYAYKKRPNIVREILNRCLLRLDLSNNNTPFARNGSCLSAN